MPDPSEHRSRDEIRISIPRGPNQLRHAAQVLAELQMRVEAEREAERRRLAERSLEESHAEVIEHDAFPLCGWCDQPQQEPNPDCPQPVGHPQALE